MQSEKKIKKYKKIELYVCGLIFFCFIIIFAKYFYFSSGSSSFSFISDFLLKKENAAYLHEKLNKIDSSKQFILRRGDDSAWQLVDNAQNVVSDYLVGNRNGKVSLKMMNGSSEDDFSIDIENVRNYFNRSGEIITDIPYDITSTAFLVPEQEDYFPIFGYHYIIDNEDDVKNPFLDIRKNDFESQISYYNKEMNCRWITFENMVENYIAINKKIPRGACVMTFDDGRRNNYDVAFPILKKNNVVATFYIIFGHLGEQAYMTRQEVAEIFRAGNDIGSHTVNGGGLVNADWFKSGAFTDWDMNNEISESKKISGDYSYNSKTFAYPLGEWNDKIIDSLKRSGYLAARDTEKDDRWRDRRALATGMTDDFLWHLNYYKTELRYNDEIGREAGYTGWWQFEDGNLVLDDNSNVHIERDIKVTDNSYGDVLLIDSGDINENSFILEKDGVYIIDMFIANSGADGMGFSVSIDKDQYGSMKDQNQACIPYGNKLYCHYLIEAALLGGRHEIMIKNQEGQTALDRFRISRNVSVMSQYNVIIDGRN